MKQLGEFVKTTILGGLLVLFPLIACVVVVIKIGELLTGLIKPLLSFLPQTRLIGVVLADVVSILVIILFCFLVGVLVKIPVGGAVTSRLNQVLSKIPGYRAFVRVSRIIFDSDDVSGTPVVVQRGESRQLGFMMEETSEEELTIFFPDAPSLFSGSVEIVHVSRVERLNVPAREAARVIATYGIGTRKLLPSEVSDKTQP